MALLLMVSEARMLYDGDDCAVTVVHVLLPTIPDVCDCGFFLNNNIFVNETDQISVFLQQCCSSVIAHPCTCSIDGVISCMVSEYSLRDYNIFYDCFVSSTLFS